MPTTAEVIDTAWAIVMLLGFLRIIVWSMK